MIPLVILLVTFVLALVSIKIITQQYHFKLAASIAMSVMLVFTGTAHFVYTKGMALMVPKVIPLKTTVVYLTGVLEIVLAVTLVIPKTRMFAGCILIIFLIVLLPANIVAAANSVDYRLGTSSGPGWSYLWFRIPLQLFFILWAYGSAQMHR